MGAKNAYLEKQRKLQQGFLDVGEEMGIQKICDYLHIALRDPEVMGKDVFGRKRLEKLFKKLNELANHYHTAFTDDKEADLVQEELDRNLKEVYGDDFQDFFTRYPYVKKQEYKKPRKGWVE
jgi:hypothetical protein